MSRRGQFDTRLSRVTSSMLWSAWADALGFISELTDAPGLRRRLGGTDALVEPVRWKRRVGGKFGVTMDLPAGCYSDDSQLRLATARALSPAGFDVEAFAAVELPLWPAYALGGGRASKAAAANLTKPNTPWFTNFFDGWTTAGGNGAAMRIQPHVWAARAPLGLDSHINDVFVNAITTHGHPRALVGAVLHAVALGQVIESGQGINQQEWSKLLDVARSAIDVMYSNDLIARAWIPTWEETTSSSFRESWESTIKETHALLSIAEKYVESLADPDAGNTVYEKMCQELGLYDAATRGSGTNTSVAALVLATAFSRDARKASLLACRELGTDTDTIATMAAAIIGAATADEPPTPVQDDAYLRELSRQLAMLSAGEPVEATRYPDLLTWQPPRSQLDACGLAGDRLALAGLAYLEPMPEYDAATSRGARWQWFKSDIGPSFLLKHRADTPRELASGNLPLRGAGSPRPSRRRAARPEIQGSQLPLLETTGMHTTEASADTHNPPAHHYPQGRTRTGGIDLDQVLDWLRRNDYEQNAIGYAIQQIAKSGTTDQIVALAAILRSELRKRTE